MAKDDRQGRGGAGVPQAWRLARHIALVGLMGAGKSSLGRRFAKAIGARFVDADREIERAAGMSISDIFETRGEADFRDGERRVIARLLEEAPLVLATGGGAFVDPDTRQLMRAKATTVWLKADLDTLVRRCGRRDTRPLLRQGDPREILGRLMEERDPLYAEADVALPSRDEPFAKAIEAMVAVLGERGDLRAEAAA